jgi:hypothetical protein
MSQRTHLYVVAYNNKVITWDNLQKRNIYGLGWCNFYIAHNDSNYHMIMSCAYAQHVWIEIEALSGLNRIWVGVTIEEGLKKWCENVATKGFRVFL